MKPTRAQTIISLITATLAAIGGLLFLRRRAPARTDPAAAPAAPPLDVSDEPALQPTPRKQIAAPLPLEKEMAGEVLSRRPNRALLTVGLLFFAAASLLLIQVGAPGLLFVFCWLMAIILAGVLLLAPLPIARPALRETLSQHAWEVPPLLVLVILAAGMQSATLAPRTALSEHEHIIALTRLTAPTDEAGVFYYAASLPDLQRLSAALAVLGILTVYAFAQRLGGPYVALFAAGFAAASGWTLALGKSGLAYPALTVFGGLLGLALLHAWQTGSRRAYGWAGLIVGLGWLFTPLMQWLALLIPLTALLSAIESRRALRVLPARLLTPLVMGAVIVLPFIVLVAPPTVDAINNTGLSRFSIFIDALASSLLQFGLMSDPNALHGLYERATLTPPFSLLFALGVLVWALHIARQPRWEHALLPLMLLVSLLPAALAWHYPDALRSAGALPFVMTLAGMVLQSLAAPLQSRMGRAGELIVALLFAALLLWAANDARLHYAASALPAAEQAAQVQSIAR